MNLLEIAQKQVVWLLVFTYNQYTIAVTIIKSQEKILTKVVTLTAFVPLLTCS
jgi:magnesium transporter